MGRKRNASGQFGGEDFAPELELERYWNEKHVTFVGAANSSTLSTTVFDTGMDLHERLGDQEIKGPVGKKWVIKGAVFQPASIDSVVAELGLAAAESLLVTLRVAGTGLANPLKGDVGEIGRALLGHHAAGAPASAGLIPWPLPLDILTPKPVFAEQLEVCVKTVTDTASFQNVDWMLTILYGWADAYIGDVLALRQLGGM